MVQLLPSQFLLSVAILGALAKTAVGAGTDLDIRFSKTPFVNASLGALYLPYHANNYPVKGEFLDLLKTKTQAASPLDESDPEVEGNPVLLKKSKKRTRKSPFSYVGYLGTLPTNPTNNSTDPFWQEFRESVRYQVARRTNADPSTLFTLPNLWAGFNLSQIAQAVNNDFPAFWSSQLLQSFVVQKAQVDYDVIPFRSINDPLGIQHRNVAINAWIIATIQPITYAVKWAYGKVRPEEIAWYIATGKLTAADGVPADLIPIIKSWNLTAATQYTAYAAGCPNHPAWPGGHAGTAQNAFWLSVVFNLTPAQYCEALRFDYAYAFARVLAGLHYVPDNYAGLKLGQEVFARKLPKHFAELYGSDPEKVAAKIATKRFDWAKFNPKNCTFSA